jgi:hypothetical protein
MNQEQRPSSLQARATAGSIGLWCVLVAILVGGGLYLWPLMNSNPMRWIIGGLLSPLVFIVLVGLIDALRLRIVIEDGMVLVRRGWTSRGFLLSEIVRIERRSPEWLVILEDDSRVQVPMDITHHERIGAALLQAEGENQARRSA